MNKLLGLLILLVVAFSCKKANSDADPENPQANLYFPPDTGAEWQKVSPDKLGWNTTEIPALLQLLNDNGTRAFIVLKDGKIVIESYFGKNILGLAPFDQSSVWYWASAGKTLTSFIVGKAQEEGFLKIEDKTSDYLGVGWTSETADQESKITIRNQLTMTTGLDDGVSNSHGTAPADLVYKANAGNRWAYHNGPYTLLEQVVANAVDDSFDNYFNLKLSDKIGMDGFWQWVDDDHVYFSTARSMARFGLLVLNNGKWAGETVMGDHNYFTEMTTPSQQINKSYGYLWWLNGKESYMLPETQLVFNRSYAPHGPGDMIAGIGKNGQYVCVVPSLSLVLIRMGENPESVQVPFLFLDDIWEKLGQVIR
jgi:CubicO group peptidase (beta-lactamase class C family)